MNIPGFLVANTLNTSVAQRLVRLLCPDCKISAGFDEKAYPRNFKAPVPITHHYISGGCEKCHFTGYRGRKAVYEVIPVDQELAIEIKNGNQYVGDLLRERGIKTLAENAFELFAQGKTSVEEIFPLLIN